MISEEMIREQYHDLRRSLYFALTKDDRALVQFELLEMLQQYYPILNDRIN